jgi:hypothetical protein
MNMTFLTKSSDGVGSAGVSTLQSQQTDMDRAVHFSTEERRAWRRRRKLRAIRSMADLRGA